MHVQKCIIWINKDIFSSFHRNLMMDSLQVKSLYQHFNILADLEFSLCTKKPSHYLNRNDYQEIRKKPNLHVQLALVRWLITRGTAAPSLMNFFGCFLFEAFKNRKTGTDISLCGNTTVELHLISWSKTLSCWETLCF